MKTKSLIITISCLVLVIGACAFFFVKAKYFNKPNANEITLFLTDFNSELKAGNADSTMNYFEIGKNKKAIALLIKVLSGKTGLNGKSAATFKISLNTDENKIISGNSDITVVEVPVTFSGDNTFKISPQSSSLTFSIHKIPDHQYKIIKVDTKVFLPGYIAYADLMRKVNPPAIPSTYSAITLAAFKTANGLKTKYDSVVWFEHVNKHTFFYVIKGKLNDAFYQEEKKADYQPTYQMGLVNPQLKEIIPPQYDLIHNIGGTFDGLIEVEKGGKRGFYDMDGKLKVPVAYDEIYPLKDGDNLALLQNGNDYFYLQKDTTISSVIAGLKIADVLQQIKVYGDSYTITEKGSNNIMESNDSTDFTSLIVSPSYLVDLQVMPEFLMLPDPLRQDNSGNDDEGWSNSLEINFDGAKQQANNWFESMVYSLYNDYVGGRSGLYESKTVVVADNKKNELLGYSVPVYYGDADGGTLNYNMCHVSAIRPVGDSLYEFATSSEVDQPMLKDTLQVVPYYHYLYVKNGKLVALPGSRVFACTKYVKIDDSYLQGCYVINGKKVDHVTNEMLQYMKNEIYGSYGYTFKNKAWNDIFSIRFYQDLGDTKNANVDDSLTVIDKYNINWINQKLRAQGSSTLAAN